MKIYIAGAITENPNYKEDFAKAEQFLLGMGVTVVNPVKNEGFSYKDYIDMGLNELMRCDAIYMLKNWKKSKGADFELQYALLTGLKVFFEDGNYKDFA